VADGAHEGSERGVWWCAARCRGQRGWAGASRRLRRWAATAWAARVSGRGGSQLLESSWGRAETAQPQAGEKTREMDGLSGVAGGAGAVVVEGAREGGVGGAWMGCSDTAWMRLVR
jgi:hypothetical protein